MFRSQNCFDIPWVLELVTIYSAYRAGSEYAHLAQNHAHSIPSSAVAGSPREGSSMAFTLWLSFAGSTSSSVSGHWLAQLRGSNARESLVSRSPATYPALPKMPASPSLISASSSQEKGACSFPIVIATHTAFLVLNISNSSAWPLSK